MRRRDFDDPFKEILGYDVRRAASSSGAELRRRRTRIVDKLLQGFGSARRRGYHFRGGRGNRHGFEIFCDVAALRVKRFIDRQRGRRAKNCIAIRLCRGDAAMRQIAGRAGSILNDHGLAELDLQLLADETRDPIDEATRRKADDDGDGLRRISVGMRWRGRQAQGRSHPHEEIPAPPKRRPIGFCRRSFRAKWHGGFPTNARVKFSAGLCATSFLNAMVMSALPSKADMRGALANVRFGPKADMTLSHSMITSARCRNVSATGNPSALAVLRLMTSSNFVGCSTGMSAGNPPCNILVTNRALCRNEVELSAP